MRCRAEKAAEELFCSRDCFLLKVHKFLLLGTKSGNKCSSITPTLGSYQSVCFTRIMRRCFAVPSPGANNKIAIERTPTIDIIYCEAHARVRPRKIKREEATAMEDYWYFYIILLLLETENRFSQEDLRAVSTNAAETHSVSSSRSYLRAKIIKSLMIVKNSNFLSIWNI